MLDGCTNRLEPKQLQCILYIHDADCPGADPAGRYGDENTDGDDRGNGGAGATGTSTMLTYMASQAIQLQSNC